MEGNEIINALKEWIKDWQNDNIIEDNTKART